MLEEYDDAEAASDPRSLKDFSLQDMLTQMRRIRRMGSFGDILKMIPGAGKMLPKGADIDEREIARVEAISSSMMVQVRSVPRLLKASTRTPISAVSGYTPHDDIRSMFI